MNASQLTFLVVEDEPVQRQRVVQMLDTLGAKHVWTAEDAERALQTMKTLRQVNVIVCDLMLPGMDGPEFLRRLAHSGFRSAVIIVSAVDPAVLRATEKMAQAYGIDVLGALGKPVTLGALGQLVSLYRPASTMARTQSRRSFTLDEIRCGLEQKQFEPFFQPKVELATGRVVGAEALARWRHPQEGIIPPADFIPALEQSGAIDELTWTILLQAIAFCRAMNAAGTSFSIAVNLPLKSLSKVDVASRISAIVRGHNVEPANVCIEITETTATTKLGTALENLVRLRMHGFQISIDDFGTGYSTIQQLTRVPLTELKIDRSFVTNASGNDATRTILQSSLQMARDLDIKAVAEGIETQQDWDLLRAFDCDLGQGYFIAKPIHAEAYAAWSGNLAMSGTFPVFAGETAIQQPVLHATPRTARGRRAAN